MSNEDLTDEISKSLYDCGINCSSGEGFQNFQA